MLFNLTPNKDKDLERMTKELIDELNDFYEIGWVRNVPHLFIVPDRLTIDQLKGKETEAWVVGWSEGQNVFVLDSANMASESVHKNMTPESYRRLIKHELSHAFCKSLVGGSIKPTWLSEGVAIYTAGQNVEWRRPKKFDHFLEYFDQRGEGAYDESGFVVELLVEKFGKQKLLKLLKQCKEPVNAEEFNSHFLSIYGFSPIYDEFNHRP
jgi:hypothetical protein